MRRRAFTMIEVTVVSAVVAIAAAVAVAGLTAALDSSRRDARLHAMFEDLVRRRAVHLGTSLPAEGCLVVSHPSAKVLTFEERTDCLDPGSARPGDSRSYDVSALTLVTGGAPDMFCVDNLARVRDCTADPVVFRDVVIEIDADRSAGSDGSVKWAQSGRLSATFTNVVDASAQPHLVDVGANSTPNPTRHGATQGVSTDPKGLLE